jgi:hypothetical protein
MAFTIACARRESANAALRGPLARILDPPLAKLAACIEVSRSYAGPFWHAPYRECRDSAPGGEEFVELDANSVVVSTSRDWRVPPGEQRAAWDREASRLNALFGPPSRPDNALPSGAGFDPTSLRSYCAFWRGPDSAEVTLYLLPETDVASVEKNNWWALRRYARHGPLAGAVSCGRRS